MLKDSVFGQEVHKYMVFFAYCTERKLNNSVFWTKIPNKNKRTGEGGSVESRLFIEGASQ